MAANRLPSWHDETGALALRQITFPFDRSYAGHEDNSFIPRLHAELPGIANWALEGLAMAVSQSALALRN